MTKHVQKHHKSKTKPAKISGLTKKATLPYQEASQFAATNGAKNGFTQFLNPHNSPHLASRVLRSAPRNELEINLAAQELEHLLSAYKYASQAICAATMGHSKTAVHFTYYSELRSALSLFASSGISTQDCFYMNSIGQFHSFHISRTHEFAWSLWDQWKTRSDAQAIFGSLQITPGVTMDDLAKALSLTSHGQAHLGRWSYDLLKLSTDEKDARNNASYRASDIYDGIPQSLSIEFITNLLGLMLPEGNPGCLSFEKYYAQWILQGMAKDYATANPDNANAYSEWLEIKIKKLAGDTGKSETLLLGLLTPDPNNIGMFDIFELAQQQDTNLKNMLSRMVVLIRLATHQLNKNLMAASGSSRCGLDWIRNWLDHLGIINKTEPSSELVYLEEDYNSAVDELASKQNSNIPVFAQAVQENFFPKMATILRTESILCWAIDFN